MLKCLGPWRMPSQRIGIPPNPATVEIGRFTIRIPENLLCNRVSNREPRRSRAKSDLGLPINFGGGMARQRATLTSNRGE